MAAQQRLFRFFDEDGSGVIDEAEMLAKLSTLGFDRTGVTQLFTAFRELEVDDGQNSERGVTRSAFSSYLTQQSMLVARRRAQSEQPPVRALPKSDVDENAGGSEEESSYFLKLMQTQGRR